MVQSQKGITVTASSRARLRIPSCLHLLQPPSAIAASISNLCVVEMCLEILRSSVRPLTRILTSRFSTSVTPSPSAFTSPKPGFHLPSAGSVGIGSLVPNCKPFPQFDRHSVSDGLGINLVEVWVQYTSGGPILPNQPNEGIVKRRKKKKSIRLLCAFILAKLQEGGT